MYRFSLVIRVIGLALLLGCSAPGAWAGSGGSAYSIFGIGDLRYATGVRSAGMGYTGLGIPGPSYINGFSPATWAGINRVRLEASMFYEGFRSTDGSRSRYLARADFNGAVLAIPISRQNGIVLVSGFLPYSTVNYDAYTGSSFTSAEDTLRYSIHHVGSGGFTRGLIGLSIAPLTNLALGFSTNVIFGSIDAEQTQVPLTSNATGGQFTERVTANGVNFTLAALYTGLGDVSPALRTLSVGAIVTTHSNLSARNQTTFRFSDAEITSERDTSAEVSRSTTIPLSFGVGISYQAGERLLLAADYFSQLWSTAKINDQSQPYLRDSYRIGFGVERTPAREAYAPWLNLISLRAGFYYHSTYYQPNGEPINEWGVTAGAGFPFSGESHLNFALEYARRGTTANGLVQDNIFRLSASLNIGALWFVQYPEE